MSKSTSRWLQRQFSDSYVRSARGQGYRSRAVYKLSEIDARERLLSPGMIVVDLGAAPGSWSQMAAEMVGIKGQVLALDRLSMEPLPGVEFIQGDFSEDKVLEELLERLGGRRVDLIISDMAPNLSGVNVIDQPRIMHLADLALEFAHRVLASRGSFLIKLFQGEGVESFREELHTSFQRVRLYRPRASRAGSRELYMVARNYRA